MVNTAKPTKRAVNYEACACTYCTVKCMVGTTLGPKARPLFFRQTTHPCYIVGWGDRGQGDAGWGNTGRGDVGQGSDTQAVTFVLLLSHLSNSPIYFDYTFFHL